MNAYDILKEYELKAVHIVVYGKGYPIMQDIPLSTPKCVRISHG